MKHPVRSAFVAAGLGVSVVLSSCTGPGNSSPPTSSPPVSSPLTSSVPVTTSPSSSPAPDDGGSSAALATFSGVREDVQYSFDHPSDWTVEVTDPATSPGYGTVTVTGPRGEDLASLDILITWGMSCMKYGCPEQPVVYLGDWASPYPFSVTGTVAARTVAMDLSENPAERDRSEWPDNVRVVTSLTPTAVPRPSTMTPILMSERVQVQTGVVETNGSSERTVLFVASRDFGTLEEARAYAASEEHRQIQAMIASFRESG